MRFFFSLVLYLRWNTFGQVVACAISKAVIAQTYNQFKPMDGSGRLNYKKLHPPPTVAKETGHHQVNRLIEICSVRWWFLVNKIWFSFLGGIGSPQPDDREFKQGGAHENCLALLNQFYNDGVNWHDVGKRIVLMMSS